MTYRLLEFPGEQFAGLHHLRMVLKVLEHFRGDFRKILKFFRGHPAGWPALFAGSAVAANEAGRRGAVKENRAHHPELKIAAQLVGHVLHHLFGFIPSHTHHRSQFAHGLKFHMPQRKEALQEGVGKGVGLAEIYHRPQQKRFSGYRAPLSPIYHDQVLKTPQRSTRSRSSFPTLKKGNFLPSTLMRSPVLGLRPL